MNLEEKYSLYKLHTKGPHMDLDDFISAKSITASFSDDVIDGEGHTLIWVPESVSELSLMGPKIGPLFFAMDTPENITKIIIWEHQIYETATPESFEIPEEYVNLRDVRIYDSYQIPIRFSPKLTKLRDILITAGPGQLDLSHGSMVSLRSICVRGTCTVKFRDDYPVLEDMEYYSGIVPTLPSKVPLLSEFFYESYNRVGVKLPPMPSAIEIHIDGFLHDTTNFTANNYPKLAALTIDGPLSADSSFNDLDELEHLTLKVGRSQYSIEVGELPKLSELTIVTSGVVRLGKSYPEILKLTIASISPTPTRTNLVLNSPKLKTLNLIWDGLTLLNLDKCPVITHLKVFSGMLSALYLPEEMAELFEFKLSAKLIPKLEFPVTPQLSIVYTDVENMTSVLFHHSSYELTDLELKISATAEIELPELTSHLKYVKLPARMVLRHATQKRKLEKSLNSIYELSDDRDVQKEVRYILDEL